MLLTSYIEFSISSLEDGLEGKKLEAGGWVRRSYQSLGWENPLEEEMATHSSILAWKIPWTEEPSELQAMGLQRVRHNWATNLPLSFHFDGLIRIEVVKTKEQKVPPCSSDRKESAHDVGDLGLIPGLGRSPEEGNGNPLQYSCLENSMDRGAWWSTAHGIAENWTQLSN